MSDKDIEKAVAPVWHDHAITIGPSAVALRLELDALRARVAELEQSVHDLCFERGALTMERERLRAALEPFGRLYKEHHHYMKDDAPIYGVGDSLVTAGDFRRAADLTRREALDG